MPPTCHTPGQILNDEFMEPQGLSQNALARAIDVPPRRINEIVLGKRKITADTDLRLCRYFGLEAGFWLKLQVETDLGAQRALLKEALEHLPSAADGDTTRGGIYARLAARRQDRPELQQCIQEVLEQIESQPTTSSAPGMLLGRIQSGKTRAFIGVIAKALDRKFDIAVVLTKGTRTLAAQTVARLNADFVDEIDNDELLVFDIMKPPGRLIKGDLKKKLIIVAKKQHDNLDRLIRLFTEDYPGLAAANVLLIDDEADLASIRFVRKRDDDRTEQGAVAARLETFRTAVRSLAFLQVTATPFSLYLQPKDYPDIDGEPIYKPMKPAFTVLLPQHEGYVGGDTYFGLKDDSAMENHLFVAVTPEEQDALREADKRRIKPANVLKTAKAAGIVRAVVTFVAAACIRQWQQRHAGTRPTKYAMVVHNDTQRSAHDWQDEVVNWILKAITEASESDDAGVRELFATAYEDLARSIAAAGGQMPDFESAYEMFVEAFQGEEVVVERVNSDGDVMALLDDKAELRLRTAFNVFIGGNILDRGITIPNLIAFYYGRNPQTTQADTVLQHSRMYGNRPRADVAVTRLYTSPLVYDRMYKINSFEVALREAFEQKVHDHGVVLIRADATGRIRPCGPDKLMLSEVVSVRAGKMYLPSRFETVSAKTVAASAAAVGKLIPTSIGSGDGDTTIDLDLALRLIDAARPALDVPSSAFEWSAMSALLKFYAGRAQDRVDLVVARNRGLDRELSGDKSGRSIVGVALRTKLEQAPRRRPALVMLEQQGRLDQGWSGTPFWWPVLVAPLDVEPCVFASKVAA
jgi:addiction module HigA family antidote